MAQKLNMHRGAYYYYYDFAKPKKTKKHREKNIPVKAKTRKLHFLFCEGKLQYLEKRQKSMKASPPFFFCFFFLRRWISIFDSHSSFIFCNFCFYDCNWFYILHMCAGVCLHFLVCARTGTTCVRFANRNCWQKCKSRKIFRKAEERCCYSWGGKNRTTKGFDNKLGSEFNTGVEWH